MRARRMAPAVMAWAALLLPCSVLVAMNACGSFGTNSPASDGGTAGDTTATSNDGGRFCEKSAGKQGLLFCDDFDVPPLSSAWLIQLSSDSGVVAIDPATKSLLTSFSSGVSGCMYAGAARPLGTSSRLRVELDVRVGDEGALATDIVYFALEFSSAGGGCAFHLAHQGEGALVNEQLFIDGGHVNNVHPMTSKLTFGRWTHVDLVVDREKGTLGLSLDQASAFATEQTLTAACRGPVTATRVVLGLHCQGTPDAPKVVRYDNVLVSDLP